MTRILSIALSTLIAAGAFLSARAQTSTMLSPLTTFGNAGDGTIQPGATDPYPPMDTGSNQRGIAYDPVSGNVVLVDTHSGGGGGFLAGAIYILDGTYGTNITTLNTNGMVYAGSGYADAAAGGCGVEVAVGSTGEQAGEEGAGAAAAGAAAAAPSTPAAAPPPPIVVPTRAVLGAHVCVRVCVGDGHVCVRVCVLGVRG